MRRSGPSTFELRFQGNVFERNIVMQTKLCVGSRAERSFRNVPEKYTDKMKGNSSQGR